jgi:hypothetical protein
VSNEADSSERGRVMAAALPIAVGPCANWSLT